MIILTIELRKESGGGAGRAQNQADQLRGYCMVYIFQARNGGV